MNCPFCGKEMKVGGIPSGRSAVYWQEDYVDVDTPKEKVVLSKYPLWGTEWAEAYYCPDCRQVIVPVPEIRSLSEKWKAKFDALTERIDQAQEDWRSRQEEKQKEKKWNKRRGKDPWEW